jgi:hypothetical protein
MQYGDQVNILVERIISVLRFSSQKAKAKVKVEVEKWNAGKQYGTIKERFAVTAKRSLNDCFKIIKKLSLQPNKPTNKFFTGMAGIQFLNGGVF